MKEMSMRFCGSSAKPSLRGAKRRGNLPAVSCTQAAGDCHSPSGFAMTEVIKITRTLYTASCIDGIREGQ